MNKAIIESELTEHIEKTKKEFCYINKLYTAGYLTNEEYLVRLNEAFSNGFHAFLRNKNLQYKFCENNWNEFLSEYNLWKKGIHLSNKNETAWLFCGNTEAAVSDKVSFFKSMEAFLIPVEYFKPFPEDCIQPNLYMRMYGTHEFACITFSLIDDGGLFSEEDPIGKTFTLVDSNNLKAGLEINELTTNTIGHNFPMKAKFISFGTIEGYTSERKREIAITDVNQSVTCLCLKIENDDWEVLNHFPLWKQFNDIKAEQNKIAFEHLKILMNSF